MVSLARINTCTRVVTFDFNIIHRMCIYVKQTKLDLLWLMWTSEELEYWTTCTCIYCTVYQNGVRTIMAKCANCCVGVLEIAVLDTLLAVLWDVAWRSHWYCLLYGKDRMVLWCLKVMNFKVSQQLKVQCLMFTHFSQF